MTCAYFRPDHCLVERLGESSGGDQSAMHSNALKEHKKNEGMIERASSMQPKRLGNCGWYFRVLKCASENGLSFEVCGLLCDLVTPRSASRKAVGLAFIGPPRSACSVS